MNITLMDHDQVEVENLAVQGYRESDLGLNKVEATRKEILSYNSSIKVTTFPERFARSKVNKYFMSDMQNCLFLCVDSMESRKFVFNNAYSEVNFFCDARVGANSIRVLTDRDNYLNTLVDDSRAYEGSCTAKMTIYLANIAAGLMLNQWSKYLRSLPLDKDVFLNLLSMELN